MFPVSNNRNEKSDRLKNIQKLRERKYFGNTGFSISLNNPGPLYLFAFSFFFICFNLILKLEGNDINRLQNRQRQHQERKARPFSLLSCPLSKRPFTRNSLRLDCLGWGLMAFLNQSHARGMVFSLGESGLH